MYSSTLLALLCICAGVSAQGGDQFISSIANQISAALVEGRKSAVPESEASSKVNEIYQLIMSQSQIQEIISAAAGINPDSIKAEDITSYQSVIQTNLAKLSTFQDSDASSTLNSLVADYIPQVNNAMLQTAISTRLATAILPVITQVSSLSAENDDVSSIIDDAGTQIAIFLSDYNLDSLLLTDLINSDSDDSTTDSDSTTATSTSSDASATSTSSDASATSASLSTHSSSSTGGSTSHSNGASSSETKLTEASSTGTSSGASESASQEANGSGTVSHSNNQSKNTIAIAGVAGAAIAAGFLLL